MKDPAETAGRHREVATKTDVQPPRSLSRVSRSAIGGAKARFRAVMMTAWSFLVGVLPLVFSSGAGCESRQAIGLVTFAGMLVATIVGIAFPPAYFSMFSRLRTKRR